MKEGEKRKMEKRKEKIENKYIYTRLKEIKARKSVKEKNFCARCLTKMKKRKKKGRTNKRKENAKKTRSIFIHTKRNKKKLR